MEGARRATGVALARIPAQSLHSEPAVFLGLRSLLLGCVWNLRVLDHMLCKSNHAPELYGRRQWFRQTAAGRLRYAWSCRT